MWNYLISGLAVGCTLVLYDGSPLRRPEFLWSAVDDLGITVFGTSAKYLDQLAVRYYRGVGELKIKQLNREDIHQKITIAYPRFGISTPRDHPWVMRNMIGSMNISSETYCWVLSPV
jgi:hypothetical protein